jgi:hypothetical protein
MVFVTSTSCLLGLLRSLGMAQPLTRKNHARAYLGTNQQSLVSTSYLYNLAIYFMLPPSLHYSLSLSNTLTTIPLLFPQTLPTSPLYSSLYLSY